MKSSIKKCISIRVLLFLLSLTVLSLDASDTRSDIEKHTAFGLINSFEKLMTPFTGGVAGAVSAGVPGMLVGVSFGLIDEGLIAFEYFDSPH